MAKMHPARLTDRVLNDRKFKGEVKTFEALSKLSDEFEVFYNRCANKGSAARVFERKIDFIIIHEKLGLLAMEVKGGDIRIGDDGGFEQYHFNKEWESIDPFTQVKVALLEIILTIKSDSPRYWIPDDMCILFPETYRRDLTDNPQLLPAGTLCAEDVAVLPNLIPTLFSKNRKGQAWPRDVYIDVRRRLQNMPEAKSKNKKQFLETVPWAKKIEKVFHSYTPLAQEDKDESQEERYEPLGEIKPTAQKPIINYQASAYYTPRAMPAISERSKVAWWEIMLLIIIPTIVFFAILWLFPNSFIR